MGDAAVPRRSPTRESFGIASLSTSSLLLFSSVSKLEFVINLQKASDWPHNSAAGAGAGG